MPKGHAIRSRAQMRKLFSLAGKGEIAKSKVEQMVHETSNIKSLPERIGKKKSRKRKR
jgi:hypothetical protein